MAKQKSIKLNFIMNAILTMSSFIFPLITFPYISRTLLPVGTGKVSFATSMISYFSMFAQLGIPTYGIRVCAKVRDNREELTRTAQELLIINLIMNVISYAALALALTYVPRLQEDRTLYVIISFTIILTSIGMEWLYKALEQYTYITVRSIIFKLVALIAMFLLIHTPDDYVVYGGITIIAASASNIFNFINVHRYIDLKPVGHYDLRRHIKPIGVFFAMSCATTVYLHLDNVMLGFMASETQVGLYDAAVKIRHVLLSVVTSLGAVLLPRVSYYVEHGQSEEFKRITNKAFSFVWLIASPMTLFFIIFAREGVLLLSGTAFEGAVVPMQIIMPTLLLVGISNLTGMQMLVPLGREQTVLYSEIAGAVVDLIINAILIPKYSSAGAAVGTLVAEIVVLLAQCIVLHDEMQTAFKSVHYCKILLGLFLGSAASFWLKYLPVGNFLTLLLSAVLFFGTYVGILLLTKESLVTEILNQVIHKIGNIIKRKD